ncbi:MAG TPA: beta-ketoacyl synthase N-terminal-like domain-containing protein [Actinocrinis sp.]|nr:beta-ketoacyl synthase N-terminal-like domain-containing protein [Actinocrinis sp.]
MEPTMRELLTEQLRLSRQLRARVRELEAGQGGPLAVVGMALRFPGGLRSPEEYWDFLTGGGDAYTEIPADRPGLASVYDAEVGRPGYSYVKKAGFLDRVAEFDADFFGVSAREAEALDPQQRLLLETSWEALERAGIAARREDRLDVGVFVGMMTAEYTDRLAAGALDRLDPYYGTGGGHCFAAGRISYTLGLGGPALTLDTACSSSLVALHSAARSLRARECRYAVVGGANLVFSPQLMVSLCQSRALAPDGRCKPFAASADGYGRGEGVAAVVLARLDDALAEGLPVAAVLRGSAVNHDGAASGLTVPSGPAQQEVIRAALRDADLSPADVSYVEAHGTGTSLGDPIEAAALDAVYGAGRPAAAGPLLMASVKARLGHLEAAAGMAGLIKVVLMLQHGAVPAGMDAGTGPLNPLIPWQNKRLAVPERTTAWTGPDRVAAVSAFGLSGTNAHALFQASDPAPGPAEPVAARPELLVLSARTEPALHALAAAVSTHLFRADPDRVAEVCHTLRVGRVAMPWRLAVVGDCTTDLARKVSLAIDEVARPRRPAGPVELVAGPSAEGSAELARLVAACAAGLPSLDVPGVALDRDPVRWLAGALGQLGVTVQIRPDSAAADPVALVYGDLRIPVIPPADSGPLTGAFLETLAALYRAGADLRFAPLGAAGVRRVPDLPTYPFQRKRFWIDEPAGPVRGAAAQGHRETDGEDVAGFLLHELAEVLRADQDPDLRSTFAELGGDSFTAMLFVKSVEDRYGIEDLSAGFAVDEPLGALLDLMAERIGAGQPAQSAAAG